MKKRCGSCEAMATHRYKVDGAPYAFACDEHEHTVIAKARARSLARVVLTWSKGGFSKNAGKVPRA